MQWCMGLLMLAGGLFGFVQQGWGKTVEVVLRALETEVVIDHKGTRYAAWTYDGLIPGRTIRLTLGDTVDITLINDKSNKHSHSLDLHAAQVDMLNEFASVSPGHRKHFRFTPRYPGVFLYHCGSMPMVQHIARGMYGIIIVDPRHYTRKYPRPDREYVLIQAQYFANAEDYRAMTENRGWSATMINGKVFHYDPLHAPNVSKVLTALPGERVRIFFANANINGAVSLHPVAGVWDRVYANGHPDNVLLGMQSVVIPVAGSATLDLVSPKDRPTNNLIIDHNMGANMRGAATLLMNMPGADPQAGKGKNILIR